jgi:hypothetical protein
MPTNKPKSYMNEYYKKNKEKWLNPTETHKRVERNKARHDFAEKVGVSPKNLNGDVDHKKPLRNGGSSDLGNLRLTSAHKNRGWRKGAK